MSYAKMTVATDAAPHIDQLPTRRRESFPEILDAMFWSFYDRCKDYSLVHIPGFYNVYQSMHYLARNAIRGDAVECGCFLGGMAMFLGLMREALRLDHMEIVLFDTFRGAPAGSTDLVLGQPFMEPCELPYYRETVAGNIAAVVGSTAGYRFVEGLVEETLRVTQVSELALLRLDTDYHSSTTAELEILYPRLVGGGCSLSTTTGCSKGRAARLTSTSRRSSGRRC